MAKKRGLWAEVQQERARRQKLQQQNARRQEQFARQAQREHDKAVREAQRREAQDEKERKRLYIEDRKAEAADMTTDLDTRITELDTVLTRGIRTRPLVTFKDLRHDPTYPPFDAEGLDVPLPEPAWEQFAPPPPSVLGKMFGGAARRERQETVAREAYSAEKARHSQAEETRLRELASRKAAYEQSKAAKLVEVQAHNQGVDDFEKKVRDRDPEAVAEYCTLALDASFYPDGFEHRTRIVYRADQRDVVVEYELPPQSLVPECRGYKYVMARDEIDSLKRPEKEVKERYARLIAQVAIRTIHEILVSVPNDIATAVTFYGHVSTTDLATGQPIRPCLLNVTASREDFDKFVLESLDPVACLRKLNALVSHHPYDLEPVRPVVDFESLLTQYKFVEGMDAVAGLDSRPDLLDMSYTEFEHLTRQLFEAMGMKSWTTVESKDDGVDAVAINEDPVMGGHCVIQAKRYRSAVGVEPIRALAGTMDDKRATTGIMVTTSWVTKEGHAFAQRHGRIRIIECDNLKYLCKEHLGYDVLISLPKPPPKRH